MEVIEPSRSHPPSYDLDVVIQKMENTGINYWLWCRIVRW